MCRIWVDVSVQAAIRAAAHRPKWSAQSAKGDARPRSCPALPKAKGTSAQMQETRAKLYGRKSPADQ